MRRTGDRFTNNATIEKVFRGCMYAQIISSLAQLTAVFIDGVITGRVLGEQALAAYGYCSPFISIVVAFSGFMLTGIASLMGRVVGSGDRTRVSGVFSTGMVMTAAAGLLLTFAALFFPGVIARLAGAEGLYREAAMQYLQGYGAGLLPSLMITALLPIMQLDGDKPRIFRTFLVMALCDIVLDLVNVYVLHWGLLGMGLATAGANWIAAVVMLMHFRHRKSLFRFERKTIGLHHAGEIASFGIFYIIKQFFMAALVFVINQHLTKHYGPQMVAVFAAISSAGGMLFCVGTGIGSAVSVLTGVYAGEEDADALREMIRTALRYSVMLNGVETLVTLLAAQWLIRLYFASGELFPAAVTGLRLYVLCTVIHSVNLTLRGYYQSMKMQAMSILFGFLHNFACIALAMVMLDRLLGVNGVWLSYAAGETAALLILFLIAFVRRGASRNPNNHGFVWDRVLFIPPSFEVPSRLMEVSLGSMEEVLAYSRKLQAFCLQEGADQRTAGRISLAVEELAGNVMRYGFTDGKKHSMDIRVTHKEDWILRIRDDCEKFDPVAFFEKDPDAENHIGLRMILKQAKEVRYTSTLDLNNLVVRF